MRFSKILGNIEDNDDEVRAIIRQCEEKISLAFTELALAYNTIGAATKIGGDPFIFQLVYPMRHICDLSAFYLKRFKAKEKEFEKRVEAGDDLSQEDAENHSDARKLRKSMRGRVLTTAATNGSAIYYSPEFVNKLSRIGVRILLQHEALHGALCHPSRRGSRMPHLFNIAVDFKVNYLILADLASRGIANYEKLFRDNMGEYILLEEYAQFLRDPFNPPAKMAHFNPTIAMKKRLDPGYQDPSDNAPPMFFAEPNLEGDMRRPEYIYDYLLKQIPKCDICGRLGKYKKPDAYRELEKKAKELDEIDKLACDGKCNGLHNHTPPHEHTDACKDKCTEPKVCDCEKNEDGSGEGYFDPFGAGGLMDEHIDADISEDEMAKRLHDAAESAKNLGGKLSGGIEEEIGELISPKMSYKDFIRTRLRRIQDGGHKSDWTRPKMKPLFVGLYSPTKRTSIANFVCLVDSSASMDIDSDVSFGISQIAAMGECARGWIGTFDTQLYPESFVKMTSAKVEELRKTKIVGRGGTSIAHALEHYEEHTGKADVLVIISDGGWIETTEQIENALPKKTDVVFLLTRPTPEFKPHGARVFRLRD